MKEVSTYGRCRVLITRTSRPSGIPTVVRGYPTTSGFRPRRRRRHSQHYPLETALPDLHPPLPTYSCEEWYLFPLSDTVKLGSSILETLRRFHSNWTQSGTLTCCKTSVYVPVTLSQYDPRTNLKQFLSTSDCPKRSPTRFDRITPHLQTPYTERQTLSFGCDTRSWSDPRSPWEGGSQGTDPIPSCR